MKEGERNETVPTSFKHEIKDLNLDETKEVEVSTSTHRLVGTNTIRSRCKDKLTTTTKTLKEFYEERHPYSYVVQSDAFKNLDDYRIRKTDDFKATTVWINFGNVYTHLHYDLEYNYLCQVKGTKRVLLFPPEDRELLYLWNTYSLNIILGLQSVYHDLEFIHIEENFVDIQNGIDNKLITDKYYNLISDYHKKHQLHDMINNGNPKFSIIKTSELLNVKLFPQFAHVFVMLEDNIFRSKNTEFVGTAGTVFVFPNAYTFKWSIGHGLILAPLLEE
jgi:hypothetical protein